MKNKKHLVALDLDGTLLTDEKQLSHKTKQIISHVIEAGHIVMIATGRPRRSSIQYYNQLKLKTPIVNFNGALIHHPLDNKWGIFHQPIPKQTALDVVETCYELNVYNLLAEIQDHVFLDKHDNALIKFFQSIEDSYPFIIGHLQKNLIEDPTSLLIYPKEEHINKIKTHLDSYHSEDIEHRNWGAPWNIIEITKKGINKAVGIHKVAQYYNIPKERIIAFGDEDNDLEMIDYAGFGVAMNNGIDELKSMANYITDSNEQDGVANFLESFFNLNVIIHT